jgi:hypothetical protein
MFRKRTRYFIFFLSTLLPVASLGIGVYLKLSSPSGTVMIALFLGLLILSSSLAYYVHIKPLRDLSSAVSVLLDTVGQRIIDVAESDQIAARLNYLAIFRPWQRLFVRRFFRIAWGLGMRYQPDNTVKFHVSKGVAGRARADRRETLVNMELPQNQNYGGFSKGERAKFPALTAIWSLPIFELDRSGNATGPILGTINLDSDTRGAWAVFTSNQE